MSADRQGCEQIYGKPMYVYAEEEVGRQVGT